MFDAQTTKPGTAVAAAPAASEAVLKSPEKAKDAEKRAATPRDAPKDTPELAELKQKLSSYKVEREGWNRTAKKYEDLLATEPSDFRRQMH